MTGIDLGLFDIRWSGLLIMLGVVMGGVVAALEAKRRGYDSEILLDFLLPLMLWGTLGARLWHVLTPPLSSVQLGLTTRHYFTHPFDLLAIWLGGLGLPGALLGGALALYYVCRKNELDFSEWLDILVPAIALGQVIGRLGNFFNQELYGLPTSLPWRIFINPEHRLQGFEGVEFYHPLFAYESILSLVNFFILFWVLRKSPVWFRKGDLFLLYLFNYGVIRFALEFLRLDVALVGGVNINQIFMGGIALIAGGILFFHQQAAQKL
jgi:phosphatidylglycerol:prolipoprotein diacylglycerol transferase